MVIVIKNRKMEPTRDREKGRETNRERWMNRETHVKGERDMREEIAV